MMKKEVTGRIREIVKMKWVFFVMMCLLGSSITSHCQMKQIRIDEIMFDAENRNGFIKTNMHPRTISANELISQQHAMLIRRFNKVLLNKELQLRFGALEINNLYVFDSSSKFCAYLFFDFGPKQLACITSILGTPENVKQADIDSGDFDFLSWRKNGLEVLVNNGRNMNNIKEWVMIITNMSIQETFDTSVFDD